MIKIYFILCILLSAGISLLAQNANFVPIVNTEAVYRQLLEGTQKTRSISCDFTQQKELTILSEIITSEGIFCLLGKDKLLWEYKKPYPYRIVINGDKMLIDNSDSKMTFDTRSNRMFREISNIMIGSVDGSIIGDNTTFDTRLFESSTEFLAELNPGTKELNSLFIKINLYFNKSNYLVSRIEMYEELGDVTTIILTNQKLNKGVESEVFNIDN